MGKVRRATGEELKAECDALRLRVAALEETELERTRVEAALRESEERFRTLVANVPGTVYRSSAEHPYRDAFISDGVMALTGYPAADFMRRGGATFGDLTIPEDRPLVDMAVAEAIRENGTFVARYRIRHANGGIRWVHDQGRVSTTRDGAPLWLDGVVIDITGLVEAEATHAALEAQLRQAQKLEAIGTLAGGIAHDFNNILTAVIGHSESLARELPPADPSLEHIAGILQASQRARDLVQQILTFSRPQTQERRPIVLDVIVTEALKMLRASLPATIEIQMSVDANGDLVLADPTQVHQAIVNLSTNAAHAMRAQGGLLKVRCQPLEVDEDMARTIPGLRPGPWALVEVRDAGHGMDQATLERIFDPFFTTKSPGEGTGLGLAVVHGIMRSHHGVVTVTSEPGQGTVFGLYFPAVVGEVIPEPAKAEPPVRGSGQHVLVVDDEPALATLATRALERFGYRVTAHTSAPQALSDFLARPDEFDLVFADVTMPHLDGLELAAQIHERRPEIPVVLTSGYSGSLHPAELLQRGIRELVGKPYLASTVAHAVARHVRPS